MKLTYLFLLLLVSAGASSQHLIKIDPITPIRISHIEIQPAYLKIALTRIVKETESDPCVSCCSRVNHISYYMNGSKYFFVDGIIKKESQKIDAPFVLNGNTDRTYSYEDIQHMPKESNLFDSLWLK